jgi:glycosyltransferase involved in cell wall biosynthesis
MICEEVVLIIPTYNEADGIEQTLHEVFLHIKAIREFRIRVLVFDSASTDHTLERVKSLQSRYSDLLLQSEQKKTGLGSAYRQAMHYALTELKADIIIEFDADLSHSPKYLKGMLEAIQGCDVVMGSRYIPGGAIPANWGWHRKALSFLGNFIIRFFLTKKYKDFTTGFRATRRSLLMKALPENFISNAYAYKLELLWRLHKNMARIKEYPIHFIDRKQGHSKLPANSIVDAFRVLFLLRFPKFQTYLHLSLILALGLLIFLPKLHVLPFRGEEPRRVVCAFEMLQSGNWFVPTVQKELFLSRPPLQNWVIAATGFLRGTFDHLTGRLPTLFSILLTTLLIYYYCISALSRRTALLAALFFLTFPQVLQLGLTAETELLFTFLLTGSFLLWHCGDLRKWNEYLKWGCAYAFLGLATLTKGINQAPLYFAAIIGIYFTGSCLRFFGLYSHRRHLAMGFYSSRWGKNRMVDASWGCRTTISWVRT